MRNIRLIASLTLLALLAGIGALSARFSPPERRGQAEQSPQAQQQSPQPQIFYGVILRNGNQFVLQDWNNNVTYRIDDQAAAKLYEGKNVKVTGTLDTSTNTIHVQHRQGQGQEREKRVVQPWAVPARQDVFLLCSPPTRLVACSRRTGIDFEPSLAAGNVFPARDDAA